jgi:hypothetical protein
MVTGILVEDVIDEYEPLTAETAGTDVSILMIESA